VLGVDIASSLYSLETAGEWGRGEKFAFAADSTIVKSSAAAWNTIE